MILHSLKARPNFDDNVKFKAAFMQVNKLLTLLSDRSLTATLIIKINADIATLDNSKVSVKELSKNIITVQDTLFIRLEKEFKLVRKNPHRNI